LAKQNLEKHKEIWGGFPPNIACGYRPDSDFPDTSLNRHFLTKQSSSSDKRGLTVVTVIFRTIKCTGL